MLCMDLRMGRRHHKASRSLCGPGQAYNLFGSMEPSAKAQKHSKRRKNIASQNNKNMHFSDRVLNTCAVHVFIQQVCHLHFHEMK
uniref:Ovule protein n=1 Tax=Steinernema glaseri TaxID=37863 RepID=A0A1I7YPC3_9BILA